MEIKEIYKYSMRKGDKIGIIETDATKLELKESWEEFLNKIENGEITDKLKKIVLNIVGEGKRGLSNEEIDYRIRMMKQLDDLNYFKDFMNEKGFLFTIIHYMG